MRTGNVYNLAAYRAEKDEMRLSSVCLCCGDGPLLSDAEIEAGHYEGGCIARHPDHADLCEWCGRRVVDADDRPNAPRRA